MVIRSVCIHGHFYQPPREDPITGRILPEPGAKPYKNWNEKILAECYRPNAELGNFNSISFNIGPTLFEWLALHDPQTGERIVEQDRTNVERFGVGNAMAQAYNHTILPLAPYDAKVTQVAWGIADFEKRFGRKPQGMWLPETAADNETLEVLVDHGIEFTILAPWQASMGDLDPTEPYRVALPGGKNITVFFYHRELSTRVSFDSAATSNADLFVSNSLLPHYSKEKARRKEPQILVVASDGELYGHHQQFRDRFLAHLVNGASAQAGLTPTFPALWLKHNPPRKEITIRDKTSWSCHHGIKRWLGDCSCTPGDGRWKAYLRRAFEKLGAELDKLYVVQAKAVNIEPWSLRNRYIQVMLGEITAKGLINGMAGQTLEEFQVMRIHLLLEAQRERQRMFTSCGWFFDDFNRIEPKNNVAYAAQVVRLVRQATGVDLTNMVMDDLRHVVSQRNGLRGDVVFMRQLERAEKHASLKL